MYVIRVNGKKPLRKALKGTFDSYNAARNAIRRLLCELGLERVLAANGYSVLKLA